jgi:hypothetical protein
MVTVRHHARPEHRQDLLVEMSRIDAPSAQVPGLILEAAFGRYWRQPVVLS